MPPRSPTGIQIVEPASAGRGCRTCATCTPPSSSKPASPVHVVAARLGHADPAITLRVYAHVLDDQASGAATTFEQVIGGSQPVVRPD